MPLSLTPFRGYGYDEIRLLGVFLIGMNRLCGLRN